MNNTQIELARHALGLPNAQNRTYRNHFVTGPGSADHDQWLSMVASGLARRLNGSEITGGDDLFRMTLSGALAVLKRGEYLDDEDFPKDQTP